MTLQRPPDWTTAAACLGMTSGDFDPWSPADELPRAERDRQTALARQLCSTCPVRLSCAVEALVHAIPDGLWGGLTPGDRRRVALRHGFPVPGAARHGTRSAYVSGCRCDDCRRSHARYERARRTARREEAATARAAEPAWLADPDRVQGAWAGQYLLFDSPATTQSKVGA